MGVPFCAYSTQFTRGVQCVVTSRADDRGSTRTAAACFSLPLRCSRATSIPPAIQNASNAPLFSTLSRAVDGPAGFLSSRREPATTYELLRVHTAPHAERMCRDRRQGGHVRSRHVSSAESYDIALLAAGGTIQAADHAVIPSGNPHSHWYALQDIMPNPIARWASAFSTTWRSPPQQCWPVASSGSRLSTLTCIMEMERRKSSTRDPRVLYVSTHQFPFYPGTGAADEIGEGEGRGFTVNVPMEAGSTDGDYALVHRDIIGPVLDEFRPELVLVSAGFDAHERDPLASMRMTVEAMRPSSRRCAICGAAWGDRARDRGRLRVDGARGVPRSDDLQCSTGESPPVVQARALRAARARQRTLAPR